MIFSSRCFPQKINKRILLYYYETSGQLVFVRFLKEIEDTKKDISKLTDLYLDPSNFLKWPQFCNFDKPNSNLQNWDCSGIVTQLSNWLPLFLGVPLGSYISQIIRHKVPNADPLVCGATLMLSVPVLFFGFFFARYSLNACYGLTFLAGN